MLGSRQLGAWWRQMGGMIAIFGYIAGVELSFHSIPFRYCIAVNRKPKTARTCTDSNSIGYFWVIVFPDAGIAASAGTTRMRT